MTDNKSPYILVTISKEELAQLPTAEFEGEIVVVDKESMIADAIAYLRGCDVIGFDTETRPSFRKGHRNLVSLVQLSSRERCYLFRLNLIGVPEPLKALLEDPGLLKVGLSIHDDFQNLRRLTELHPEGFIDLQPYVKHVSIIDNSLSKIYGIVFGKRISKSQRLTNWEASELSSHQQHYAALDAYACLKIYDDISSGNFHPESSEYIQDPANNIMKGD